MLTSVKNPRIQHVRKLQSSARARRDAGLFVVEGLRLVEEALISGCQPEALFYTQDVDAGGREIILDFEGQGVEVWPLAPHVMQAASDTQTPQGILAVLPMMTLPLREAPDFLLVVDAVRDPGNLGTILRTALAAGADAVLLPPGGVDPFSPKVLRAGMGAHFRLPIHTMDWEDIETQLAGLSVFLADSSEGQPLYQSDFAAPLGIIIGGEAQGAGSRSQELAAHRVHIPMPGKTESLNAAVAAAILMFEVVRQRN